MKRIRLFIIGNSLLLALWLIVSFYTPSVPISISKNRIKKIEVTSAKEEGRKMPDLAIREIKNKAY